MRQKNQIDKLNIQIDQIDIEVGKKIRQVDRSIDQIDSPECPDSSDTQCQIDRQIDKSGTSERSVTSGGS